MNETPYQTSSRDVSGEIDTFIPSEQSFYRHYEWCLNPFLSINQVLGCLRSEVNRLDQVVEVWQQEEVRMNIIILSCAISDSVDDFLSSNRFNFFRIQKVSPKLYRALSFLEKVLNQRFAQQRLKALRTWRVEWQDALHQVLLTCTRQGPVDPAAFTRAANNLVGHLRNDFPKKLLQMRINSPRAFRSQDLTFKDIVTLARRFCEEHASPGRPCLVIGLRTAGSYFGPVLRAYMDNAGYTDMDFITLRPKGGVTTMEMRRLRNCAARHGLGIIIDEPIYQGITLGICMQILRKAGFSPASISVLFPVHPAARNWRSTNASNVLKGCQIITIEPEETFRHSYLGSIEVKETICSYFGDDESSSVAIVEDPQIAQLNNQFHHALDKSWHSRLMRAYAVHITKPGGNVEVHHVIAKSIGFGWNAYQAYFAAKCLTPYIRKPLGLRYGCLFSEMQEASSLDHTNTNRNEMIMTIAGYVTARVNGLRFPEDPSPSLCELKLQSGMDTNVFRLSHAYNSRIVSYIKRPKIRKQLSQLSTSYACLVDGNMDVSKWLDTGKQLLKTEFEDNAMGRMEASLTDPAVDLATAIRSFGLTRREEKVLLKQYTTLTGDSGIEKRLYFYQLTTDIQRITHTLLKLNDEKLAQRQRELSQNYINEWTASMNHMADFCGSFLPKICNDDRQTREPLVFLDVDGVIDRHTFNFPTTTLSGVRALSLLRTHGFRVYLNTARSCDDVKTYCATYGLQGGAAESGSYIWDAVTGREQILIESQTIAEIQRTREALEKLPGVFINHFYRYSIKAFISGKGGTKPVPAELVNKVLTDVGAKSLTVHHTNLDTAIVADMVNKGSGLKAMQALLNVKDAETIAVADTAPDLAMFQAASRCYAPSHTNVRKAAVDLGCHVVKSAYQNGFLEIARNITHPHGDSCPECIEPRFECDPHSRLIVDLLEDIDVSKAQHLIRAMLDLRTISAILR